MSSALDRLAKRGVSVPGERGIDIPLAKIRFDPTQPRKAYHHLDGRVAESDEAYIAELAQTIEENGLIQAITVQEMGDGTYLVVVGECRTRAHLLLGKTTIRAVVRNDLTNASRRLLYQLVENVTRQKLTDQELSEAIQKLKEGGDGVEPLSQVQIAKTLGKSEGWVSRFVKFGDEELQRLWVKSGIADSVEHLYRLSILPSAMQVDIRRRVELPKNDIEWLEKPLRREIIDRFTKEAKVAKKKDAQPVDVPPSSLSVGSSEAANDAFDPQTPSDGVGTAAVGSGDVSPILAGLSTQDTGSSAGWKSSYNGVPEREIPVEAQDVVGGMDVQAQADSLAAAVVDRYAAPAPTSASLAPADGKYQLSEDARAAILGSAKPSIAGAGMAGTGAGGTIAAPVNCRVSVGSVMALLDVLRADDAMSGALDGVQCELNIPGELAQLIANQLVGVIVDHKEVPAIMQREMIKLGQAA